eukprot:5732893-Pyramimonas_sp.AAC.1
MPGSHETRNIAVHSLFTPLRIANCSCAYGFAHCMTLLEPHSLLLTATTFALAFTCEFDCAAAFAFVDDAFCLCPDYRGAYVVAYVVVAHVAVVDAFVFCF